MQTEQQLISMAQPILVSDSCKLSPIDHNAAFKVMYDTADRLNTTWDVLFEARRTLLRVIEWRLQGLAESGDNPGELRHLVSFYLSAKQYAELG